MSWENQLWKPFQPPGAQLCRMQLANFETLGCLSFADLDIQGGRNFDTLLMFQKVLEMVFAFFHISKACFNQFSCHSIAI